MYRFSTARCLDILNTLLLSWTTGVVHSTTWCNHERHSTYSGYCYTFVSIFQQTCEMEFVPWRLSPSVPVLRHLNVSWLLLFSMIVSIKLYSAVHPVRRRPTEMCWESLLGLLFQFHLLVVWWWSSSFQAVGVRIQTEHWSGWRKWASAMHAKFPYTEIVPVIPTIVPESTSDTQ